MITKEKNNSNCISGSCNVNTEIKEQDENINYEEVKKNQDKADKELFKPFIVFGDHSDEVDINFNNFDIRENFREYHFSDKRYTVLPNIINTETILQFTLPHKKELENYTYLLLNIWNNESLWRVHSRQIIYYDNKLALQFDCKRDYFNEYFGLKRYSISLLKNIYILRANFLKPSLENLKICSQACLNDTDPKQVILSNDNGGKQKITSSTYYTIKLWEIKTTNYSRLKDVIRSALGNFNYNFWNGIKDAFPTLPKINDVYPHSNIIKSFGWDRYYVKVDNIFKWNYYSLYWTIGGSSISKSSLSNTQSRDTVSVSSLNLFNTSPISNIVGNNNVRGWTYNGYQYLIWNYKGKNYINYSTASWGSRTVASVNWCRYTMGSEPAGIDKCQSSTVQQLLYCGPSQYPFVWYEDYNWRGCGDRELYVSGTVSYKYLSYDSSEVELIRVAKNNLPGGDIYIPDIEGTIYDGQEPSSVYIRSYQYSSVIDEIADKIGISKSKIKSSYDSAISTLFATIKNNMGVTVREVNVYSGGVSYGSSAYVSFNTYDNSANVLNNKRYFDLDFVRSIALSTDIVYRKVNASTHYEATHIQDYLVGNSVGAFQVKRQYDYLLKNRNSGEQVIYSSTLPELMETGTVTVMTRELQTVASSQLELERLKAMLELQNTRDDEQLRYKIDVLNRNTELNNRSSIERNNIRSGNALISKIGAVAGGAIGAGIGGGIGAGVGSYIGGMITGNLANNNMINYENKLREFQTKNSISDLINENDMNKKFRQQQFNLNSFFANNVSGHLVNVSERKFPWISSTRDIFLLRVAFGDKNKIETERIIFGDFINQYYDINEKSLLEKNFIQIDSSKSDIVSLPGLDAIGNQLIIDLLNKGVFIHKPAKGNGITRVW